MLVRTSIWKRDVFSKEEYREKKVFPPASEIISC